jgi:hypothetical protein
MGSWPPRVMIVEHIWVIDAEYKVWQPFVPRIIRALGTDVGVMLGLERDWLRKVVYEPFERRAVALTEMGMAETICGR